LIAHSIRYALAEPLVDQVLVSTDDPEIATAARQYGAQVLARPATLAQDDTPTAEVVAFHARQWAEQGHLPAWLALLQPTNPLRPVGLIGQALATLRAANRESLVTFSPLHRKFGRVANKHFVPENYRFGQRSQDLEPRYFENGLLYLTAGSLALAGQLFGPDPYPYLVGGPEGEVDIDTPTDLWWAEYLYQKLAADAKL
jgi:N-acylneuraminate cytidylyltransferase